MNFTMVKSLTIPQGSVAQLADANGNVMWNGSKVVLEVEKITSNTYANSTTYSNEEFILLDIYPKTNGTVSVTYGDVTKTITDTSGAAEPTAQKVFFGTFYGVSDSITTPSSGTLTIEGDCRSIGIGVYNKDKKWTGYCSCVTAINNLGGITHIGYQAFYECLNLTKVVCGKNSQLTSIGNAAFSGCTNLTSVDFGENSKLESIGTYAFSGCTSLTSVEIPDSVTHISNFVFNQCSNLTKVVCGKNSQITSIGDFAFAECSSLASVTIPNSVTSIGEYAFGACPITSITIPDGVTSIGAGAFYICENLESVNFDNTVGWYIADSDTATSGTPVDVTDSAANATLLTSTYAESYWHRS